MVLWLCFDFIRLDLCKLEIKNEMNAFWLLLPFLFIRFVLLSLLNKKAIRRAAYFAPVKGKEKIAYYIYQISNLGIFVYLYCLTIEVDCSLQFYAGLFCYLLGLGLCIVTMINFSFPDATGLNRKKDKILGLQGCQLMIICKR